ncbi:uncharacterized protein LOC62_03G004105 [Vanrija pseudolonga]|uniref:SnoaL-like domain-containing protein n=1 Tax=Vanrija pseudolonga TaxID=143232 RepID=A0AAF1BK36_9TREE|nr:hypothetical protein LOC62_03G004105 [Vanrija pseudolonga]
MAPPSNLHPAVARSLATWHEMIAARDLSRLETIVHPNAVFHSPMSHNAYTPRAALILALSTVITIFEDFAYHRELATDDGKSVVLEFSAKANGKSLKGIDLIRFDDDGKIVEFEVMVRPLSGLQALGGEMGKRLGDKLPAYKAKL